MGECYGTIIPNHNPREYGFCYIGNIYYVLFIKPFNNEEVNYKKSLEFYRLIYNFEHLEKNKDSKLLNERLDLISKKYLEYIINNNKLLEISTNNLLSHGPIKINMNIFELSDDELYDPKEGDDTIYHNPFIIEKIIHAYASYGLRRRHLIKIFNYFANFQFTNVNTDNIYKLKEDKNNLIDELNKQKEEINELKSIIKKMKNINKITL